MDEAEGSAMVKAKEYIHCSLRKVPHSGEACDWNGPWKDQITHFFVKHSSMIHHYNEVVLEPEKPRVLVAYSDMFITYAAYHKDDLACIVMHTCSCNSPYFYRCTLLSGNISYSDIQSKIIPAFTKVKKFRSIRKHKHVTRFSPEQLDSRKDPQGKNNILIEILGPDCEEASRTETSARSDGGGKDDSSEEDRSSDEESLSSKNSTITSTTSTETMNAVCSLCWFGDKNQQCQWKGTKEELEEHLLKEHGVKLGMYGHCSKDFERVAPLICYKFLTSETHFTAKPSLFDYIMNKPSNCVIKLKANLCCCTITLPNEDWRYGWPPEMEDVVYAMMWDVFRPATTLNIPITWNSVPVMGTYPCHIIRDSSELEQLTVDNCPCRTPSSKRAAAKPPQLAYCALNFVPGRTGLCNWIGSSEMLYDHLFRKHQSLVCQDDKIVLQIEQPRILCAYKDAFLCYISYDRGDVICVVLHTCSCSKVYLYRCVLLSGVEGLSEVDGDMRYVINACKDYKWLRSSSNITRFPRAVVQPRKNGSGKISVVLKIYPPTEQGEDVPSERTPGYTHPWANFLFHPPRDASFEAAKPSTSGTPHLAESMPSTSTINTPHSPSVRMPFTSNVSTLYDPEERTPFNSIPHKFEEIIFSAFAASTPYGSEESNISVPTDRALRDLQRSMFSACMIDSAESMSSSSSISMNISNDPEETTSSSSTVSSLNDSEESKPFTSTVNTLRDSEQSMSSTPAVSRLYAPEETMPFRSTVRRAHDSEGMSFASSASRLYGPEEIMPFRSTVRRAHDSEGMSFAPSASRLYGPEETMPFRSTVRRAYDSEGMSFASSASRLYGPEEIMPFRSTVRRAHDSEGMSFAPSASRLYGPEESIPFTSSVSRPHDPEERMRRNSILSRPYAYKQSTFATPTAQESMLFNSTFSPMHGFTESMLSASAFSRLYRPSTFQVFTGKHTHVSRWTYYYNNGPKK